MEPNQNTNTVQNTAGASTVANVSSASSTPLAASDASIGSLKPGSDVVFQDKPKKNMGVILTIVLLALLAAGGIGFGVWAMMDGNSQVAKKDEQIADLRGQLAEKSEAVVEDITVVDVETEGNVVYKNPVIKPTNSEESYRLNFDFSASSGGEGFYTFKISVKNGSIESCKINRETYEGGLSTPSVSTTECSITGLEGEIFKVITFGDEAAPIMNRIGFVMVDGSVKYTLPMSEIVSNNDLGIKGSLKINGKVSDALTPDLINESNGYGLAYVTVFILSDGSYVQYSDSMMQ